ncbi:MAG: peptidyl-prolyl cis-trans isomerase [Candidatus Sumerlaeia bacterium]|nr:peptidyl-prolyl cis-trans isomerase [Candidatus Sumerlaeia bacterium]
MKLISSLPLKISASLMLASGLLMAPVMTAGLLAAPAPVFLEAPQPLGDAPELNFDNESFDIDKPILRINGRDWSVRELQYLVGTRRLAGVSVPPVQIGTLRGDDLAHVGRLLGAHEYMAHRAKEAGLSLNEEQEERLRGIIRQYAETILYKEEVLDKAPEPTEAEIQAVYDGDRETRYKVREEMRLMHIYTSTYLPYKVAEGDTLESIALEIGGNEALADRILSNETKRPRSETLVNDEGEELVPRALVVGEELLVPTEGEKADAARNRIKEAAQAIADGADFREIAEKYSEAERPGRPWVIRPTEQDRPIREEIHEAFFSLEDGEVSEPIRTPHGFQIIKRVSYTPSGYRELDEELSSTIATNLQNEKLTTVSQEFIQGLFKRDGYVEIHEAALEADEFTDADVLVTIGSTDITRGELNQAAQGRLPSPLTAEGLKEMLPTLRPSLIAAINHFMDAEGYFERDRIKMLEAAIRESFLAETHLERNSEEMTRVSDEAISQFYEENPLDYERPERFELYSARLALIGEGDDAEARTISALASRLSNVRSLEDFKELSDELAATANRNQRAGGFLGNVERRNLQSAQLDAASEITVPGVTEVYFFRGNAEALWVESHTPAGMTPLEEVAEDIREKLMTEGKVEAKEEMILNAARHSKVEVLGN